MQKISIHGKFANATIYTVDNKDVAIEEYALAQVKNICDFEAIKGNKICVMPDVHAGQGCVIGLTMALSSDKVLPNLVGVDIGCGVLVAKLSTFSTDFAKLDTVIRENVPSGFAVHEKEKDYSPISNLACAKHVQLNRARQSLGTLGGGNHFCELACGEDGHYLVIHTGSRHLGKEVCEWYLRQGRKKGVPYELTWLEGDLREEYLNDIEIVQDFAHANRLSIAQAIIKGMKWKISEMWESVHNYIDFSRKVPILRKGAISASLRENVIIPTNMRDGSLIGVGKGNAAWNFSAPHGAGRIASRKAIQERFTLSQFKEAMQGIYSSCISKGTLDEAPFAYRSEEDIRNALSETVEIRQILRPLYNYKAQGEYAPTDKRRPGAR